MLNADATVNAFSTTSDSSAVNTPNLRNEKTIKNNPQLNDKSIAAELYLFWKSKSDSPAIWLKHECKTDPTTIDTISLEI